MGVPSLSRSVKRLKRQRVEPSEGAQPFEKLMNAASNQRFASGDADFPHAQFGEQARGSEELLDGQYLGPRQEFHGLCHAVLTSKITAVCHGQTQVRNPAIEAVDQLCRAKRGHQRSLHKGAG